MGRAKLMPARPNAPGIAKEELVWTLANSLRIIHGIAAIDSLRTLATRRQLHPVGSRCLPVPSRVGMDGQDAHPTPLAVMRHFCPLDSTGLYPAFVITGFGDKSSS